MITYCSQSCANDLRLSSIMTSNSRGIWVVSISVVLGIIDALAVMLRFVARRKCKSGLAMDDWLLAASLIPNFCMIVIAGFCDLVSSLNSDGAVGR